jgi:hypothetical protein
MKSALNRTGKLSRPSAASFFFGLIFIFPAILICNIKRHWASKPKEMIYDIKSIDKAMLTEIFKEKNSRRSNLYIKQRYSAFLDEISLDHGPKVLILPFYFMLRRLMMALIIVIFRNFLWMQLFLKAMSIVTAVILIG